MTKLNLRKMFKTLTFRHTTFEKATGLMFKKKLLDEVYVFPFSFDSKIPIHMLFVFFTIDVVWINSSNEVVDLRRNALPFMPAIYHRGQASTLIEMPKGSIDKFKIKLMDKIEV